MEGIVANSLLIYVQMKKAEAKVARLAEKLYKETARLTNEQFASYVVETAKYDELQDKKEQLRLDVHGF